MRAKTYFGKVQKARTGEANPHYSAVRLFAALPQLPEPWPDHLTRAVQSARKRVLEELFNCLTTLDSDKLRK